MNFLKSENDKLAQQYSEKLPENEIICKDILNSLNNKDTKVILDKEIKNSYYVFLNDRIYISDNKVNDNLYTRIVLIAHECIHSIQSKILQILNYLFSNVEVLMFLILLGVKFITKTSNIVLLITYLMVVLIAIIFRSILEFDAVKRSLNLGLEYLLSKTNEKEAKVIIECSKKYIVRYFPLFVLSLHASKIFRGALAFILYKYL